jgi:drug/metabolite transporter (DMT)-like permease
VVSSLVYISTDEIVAFLGLIVTALASIIEQKAYDVISPSTVVLMYTFDPIFTTFFGAFFLKEEITLMSGLGAMLIVSGCVLDTLSHDETEYPHHYAIGLS